MFKRKIRNDRTKNLKESIIAMMDSYDEYSYSRTLRFFEAYYPYDNEDVHYADVMLSMNQCKTIDELIAVRERLKEKIEKISYYNAAKLPMQTTVMW